MEIDFKSKRHRQYDEYMALFNNEPERVFHDRVPGLGKVVDYIALNIPREICTLYRDLIFKKNINAVIKDNDEANKACDRLMIENRFHTMLAEASVDVAAKGGIVFKNYLDNGKSKITVIQPDFYFPEFSQFNKREVIKETIAFTYQEGKQTYIYMETYENRNGEYWCITKRNKYNQGFLSREYKIGEEVYSDEVNTKLTQSPLTYIPLYRVNGEFFGRSIFDGNLPLFDELNWRCGQISKILNDHADPNMYADESFFDEKNQLASGGKAYKVDSKNGEEPPGYITWDGKLDNAFAFIKDILLEFLYLTTPLKPSLYGLGKDSSLVSGRAIKMKSWRTISMVENSLLYWREGIQKVLHLAQQLEVLAGTAKYIPAIPEVQIYVDLPKDDFEEAQTEQLKVVAGNTSIKSSIARLNPHMTSEEVENEWLEILNEQAERDNMTFANHPLNGEA